MMAGESCTALQVKYEKSEQKIEKQKNIARE